MNNNNIVILSTKNDTFVCAIDGKASKIRNGSTSPIKYTIFSQFAQYANNRGEKNWSELFTNAARGSFHKGYKFTDGKTLTIKVSGVIQKCEVIPYNETAFHAYYENCKEFITKTSGISSHLDDNSSFVPLPDSKKENKYWSGTIQPPRQIAMIRAFADEMGDRYNFTENKKDELSENLIGKIFINDFGGNEINCDGCNIISIDGLTFTNGNFNLIDKPIKQQNKQKKKTTTTIQEEEEEHNVFKCSKNLSLSLKRRYEIFV